MAPRISLYGLIAQFRPLILPSSSSTQITQVRNMKTIRKRGPKPASRFNRGVQPVAQSSKAAWERRLAATPFRTGVMARKKGMTGVYNQETGERIPVTVLQLDRNQILAHKTFESHGYNGVQVGFGYRHPENHTRAMLGHFAASKVAPKEELAEFRVREKDALLPIGTHLGPSWFKVGQFIDARSKTKGKGFAGVSQSAGRCPPREKPLTVYLGYETPRLVRPTSKSRPVSHT
jgi:large subunit ribosomal protein L3